MPCGSLNIGRATGSMQLLCAPWWCGRVVVAVAQCVLCRPCVPTPQKARRAKELEDSIRATMQRELELHRERLAKEEDERLARLKLEEEQRLKRLAEDEAARMRALQELEEARLKDLMSQYGSKFDALKAEQDRLSAEESRRHADELQRVKDEADESIRKIRQEYAELLERLRVQPVPCVEGPCVRASGSEW